MNNSTTSEPTHKKPKFFGHELPNGSRTGLAMDSPIKVIASPKFIEAEVRVITTFLSVYETVAWDVLQNHIVTSGEKKIDCYEILVSDWSDSTKEVFTVEFFFDITDCLE